MVYLATLLPFLQFFGTSLAMAIGFVLLYTLVTPQNELSGIRAGNLSPTLSLGGAAIGFALPLGAVIKSSVNLIDLLLWGGIITFIQLLAFGLAYAFYPSVSKKVDENCLHAGIYLAVWSIVVGMINAACLTS